MNEYYTFNQLKEYIELFNVNKYKLVSRKKVKYYNIACAFDIETTSLYKYKNKIYDVNTIIELKEENKVKDDELEKQAYMYIFMLSIDNNIIIGRTWAEFLTIIAAIENKFNLTSSKRLIIYVHNLSYEFQFMRKLFDWQKVFASDKRQVIYAETETITFKCSYFLSNTSLEQIGKNLTKYKAAKQVGKLDYNKLRNSITPLTNDEILYCIYDVIVLTNYIKEKIEEEKSICKIPLTATGYVRRYCKQYCNSGFNRFQMYKIFNQMKLDERLYAHLKRAFMGGYTHANAINTDVVIDDVYSNDETSAYPSVLLLRQYPISKPYPYKPKSVKDFHAKLNKYAAIFDITFYNIRLKDDETNSIISQSKCFECVNPIVDNGRIVSADKISITLTDVDYKSINSFYNWDKIGVGYMRIYHKGYLPKCLLECILHFYESKTKLKDVTGKEREYMNLKSMLNSVFGMMVTDIIRNDIIYDANEWQIQIKDVNEQLEHYNNNKSRFLSYEWGVWCTAYARENVFRAIKKTKSDFIYADTDSVKFKNYSKYQAYFNAYNKEIDVKTNAICKHYDLDIKKFRPKTIKGIEKPIGYWDFDGHYKNFKTLGAKRYLYQKDDDTFSLTVSGLNKKIALPYMIDNAKKLNMNIFDTFTDDLYIKPHYSGKLLHTYIDDIKECVLTDYLGNSCKMREYSSIHLEPTPYCLSISSLYNEYIKQIKTKYTKDF